MSAWVDRTARVTTCAACMGTGSISALAFPEFRPMTGTGSMLCPACLGCGTVIEHIAAEGAA